MLIPPGNTWAIARIPMRNTTITTSNSTSEVPEIKLRSFSGFLRSIVFTFSWLGREVPSVFLNRVRIVHLGVAADEQHHVALDRFGFVVHVVAEIGVPGNH